MCCMDLDEMLHQEMDELDYSPDAGIGLLSLIYRMCCNTEFYYVRKIPCIGIGRLSLQRRVVLFTASHENNFV